MSKITKTFTLDLTLEEELFKGIEEDTIIENMIQKAIVEKICEDYPHLLDGYEPANKDDIDGPLSNDYDYNHDPIYEDE